jgi:hypothetical protein
MKKRQIPQHLKDLIQAVNMSEQEATWDCHGTPVIYHDALERIADHVGITFEVPREINCDLEKGIFCVHYVGTDGDKIAESYGEATPQNNKNAYASAMAEKRAKDRVILKLIGLSGQVYSNDEADWKKIEKERKEEERRKKEQETINLSDSTNEPEPEVEEPIEDGPSIIRDTQTQDQVRELDTFEFKVYQCEFHINNFVTIEDANSWYKKNEAFLSEIEQRYPIDHKIIKKLYNNKWTEITSK